MPAKSRASLKVIVSARRKTGAFDLEALEEATRAAMQQAGAALLQTLLGEDQEHEPDTPRPCSCGQPAHCEGQWHSFNGQTAFV